VVASTVKGDDGKFAEYFYQVQPTAVGGLGTTMPKWTDPRKSMDPPRPLSENAALTEEVSKLMGIFTSATTPLDAGAVDDAVSRAETALLVQQNTRNNQIHAP